MIETKNLVKSVESSEGMVTILDDISIRYEAGETGAIVGASGSGKSTLLGLMAVSYTHLTLPTILLV